MQANPRRLELLRRLERLREVEKREAERRAADAQDTQSKLSALEARSGEIAASYAARRDATTGADLARLLGFTHAVGRIRRETASEHARAEVLSGEALAELHRAERKREVTSERLSTERRGLRRLLDARDAQRDPVLARKLKG
jgi:hypothetical protein